jgi:hypothetical protein
VNTHRLWPQTYYIEGIINHTKQFYGIKIFVLIGAPGGTRTRITWIRNNF